MYDVKRAQQAQQKEEHIHPAQIAFVEARSIYIAVRSEWRSHAKGRKGVRFMGPILLRLTGLPPKLKNYFRT